MRSIGRRLSCLTIGFLVGAASKQWHNDSWLVTGLLLGVLAWIFVDPLPVFRAIPIAIRQAKYNLQSTWPGISSGLLGFCGLVGKTVRNGTGRVLRGILLFMLPVMTVYSWFLIETACRQYVAHKPVNITLAQLTTPSDIISLSCVAVLAAILLFMATTVVRLYNEFREKDPFTGMTFGRMCIITPIFVNPLTILLALTMLIAWAAVKCIPKMLFSAVKWIPKGLLFTAAGAVGGTWLLLSLLHKLYLLTHSQLRVTATTDTVLGFLLGQYFWHQPLTGLVIGLVFCLVDHFVIAKVMPKTDPFARRST